MLHEHNKEEYPSLYAHATNIYEFNDLFEDFTDHLTWVVLDYHLATSLSF